MLHWLEHESEELETDCGPFYATCTHAHLTFDTHQFMCSLKKGAVNGQKEPLSSFYTRYMFDRAEAPWINTYADMDYVGMDSARIHGTWFYNVGIALSDTTMYPAQTCWRFYHNKELGLIGADFRGGHWYVLEQ